MNTLPAREQFLKLYDFKREDDKWDYKKEVLLDTKSKKYNLIKDFLAFSNFGGGYLLIGVNDKDKSFCGVTVELDPVNIGNVIDDTLKFNIKFELSYFNIEDNGKEIRVGLIYIYPSTEIHVCPVTLNANNKSIVKKGDIYTRRNTSCIKVSSKDLKEIQNRILNSKEKSEDDVIEDISIFENSEQVLDNLDKMLNNPIVEIEAKQLSLNIRCIYSRSKHSKKDFAKLIGVNLNQFEDLLKGKEIPSLEILVRISNLMKIEVISLFRANHLGFFPFWENDMVKFAILKLIKPSSSISRVKNINKFLGSVAYDTAKNIINLDNWIKGENEDYFFKSKFFKYYETAPEEEIKTIKGALSNQYYKLLEQIGREQEYNILLPAEELVLGWFFYPERLISRIFIESIKEIRLDNNEKPIIKFYFWEEIAAKKVRNRRFDSENLKIIFSKSKKRT